MYKLNKKHRGKRLYFRTIFFLTKRRYSVIINSTALYIVLSKTKGFVEE